MSVTVNLNKSGVNDPMSYPYYPVKGATRWRFDLGTPLSFFPILRHRFQTSSQWRGNGLWKESDVDGTI
jgi:hypothetical protein